MSDRSVHVLEGSTFVVGDDHGDLSDDAAREHGFYSDDTRFISLWRLRVGPDPLRLLGIDQASHFDCRFFLTADVGPHDQAPFSVVRSRLLDAVWSEAVTVVNHRRVASAIRVELDVAADFADLFEVKDGVVGARSVRRTGSDGVVRLAYSNGPFRRAVEISSDPPGLATPAGLAYDLVLEPGQEWSSTFVCTPESAQVGRGSSVASGQLGPWPSSARASSRSSTHGCPEPHRWCRAPPRSRAPTARASRTSRHCASIPTSPRARPSRLPGCRGSWRSSAATAS